jgi:hypothetical protein
VMAYDINGVSDSTSTDCVSVEDLLSIILYAIELEPPRPVNKKLRVALGIYTDVFSTGVADPIWVYTRVVIVPKFPSVPLVHVMVAWELSFNTRAMSRFV